MTSIKAVAAIAVVIVVVAAAVAVALTRGGGNDDSQPVTDAIGSSVSVGDRYTLESAYTSPSGTTTTSSTQYEVTAVDGDAVTVSKTSGSTTETVRDSTEGFLDDVAVTGPVGQYLYSERLATMGGVLCDVYYDDATVGNSQIGVSTTEWIGQGSNVIYQTLIQITSPEGKEIQRITLTDTNMIRDDANPGYVPSTPDRPQQGTSVRTDVQAGDYVQYRDLDDWDTETIRVISVDNGIVTYTDDDDFDWDDRERLPVEQFLALFMYTGDSPQGTESLSTSTFGTVRCDVFELGWGDFPGLDRDETVTLWVGQSDDVIYRAELREYGDRDVDGYELVATSLFQNAPSGGGDTPDTPAPAAGNRYGVTLAVGDSYTVTDERGIETTYEIAAIDGRILVKETERIGDRVIDVEYDWETGNEFLEDIMVTQQQIDRMQSAGQEAVGSVQCRMYTYQEDWDETVTLWVGPNNVVWKVQEQDGRETDTDTLTGLNIAAL